MVEPEIVLLHPDWPQESNYRRLSSAQLYEIRAVLARGPAMAFYRNRVRCIDRILKERRAIWKRMLKAAPVVKIKRKNKLAR